MACGTCPETCLTAQFVNFGRLIYPRSFPKKYVNIQDEFSIMIESAGEVCNNLPTNQQPTIDLLDGNISNRNESIMEIIVADEGVIMKQPVLLNINV